MSVTLDLVLLHQMLLSEFNILSDVISNFNDVFKKPSSRGLNCYIKHKIDFNTLNTLSFAWLQSLSEGNSNKVGVPRLAVTGRSSF